MRNLKANGVWILLKDIQPDNVSEESGLITVRDESLSKVSLAKVYSVGSGVQLSNGNWTRPNVKEGDEVIYRKYAAIPIELDGEVFLSLYDSDILAVLEERASDTRYVSDISQQDEQ